MPTDSYSASVNQPYTAPWSCQHPTKSPTTKKSTGSLTMPPLSKIKSSSKAPDSIPTFLLPHYLSSDSTASPIIRTRSISIQLITPLDDSAELRQFHERIFPVQYPDTFYSDLYQPHVVAFLARDASSRELLAVATGRVTQNEPPSQRLMGYIMTLGVVPELHRKGLGSRLLQLLIKKLLEKQVATIELDVLISNSGALDLYTKNHFHIVGVQHKYYLINGEYHDSYHLIYQPSSYKHANRRNRT